jgi:hypothetical protein
MFYDKFKYRWEITDWVYYRIKQIDFNRTSDYSPVKMIQIPIVSNDIKWSAFPNPTYDELYLKSSFYLRNIKTPILIKLYNINSNNSITLESFDSEINLTQYIKLFNKEILIIEINNNNKIQIIKVLIK